MATKLMLMMYTTQAMTVRRSGRESTSFSCKNGVKQGAVLSPVKKLEHSELRHRYAGVLCYADDVALTALSCEATKRMLGICEDFSNQYHVKFNSSKSLSIVVETE